MCPCCLSDGRGDGKRNHSCPQASDNEEEDNKNEDFRSTLSPEGGRCQMEESKQNSLVIYGELGKKLALQCHHCPFQLPWNHGVTSRMHAHEACHFRTSQFGCRLCGWNAGNIMVARKHMTLHPDAKPSDLIKKWGKRYKPKSGPGEGSVGTRRKASQISSRKSISATNIEIIKNLTQKARIIKANTPKSPAKYGSNTVGALLQRKRAQHVEIKIAGKTIKEILNLKGERVQEDSLSMQQTANLASATKDLARSAKTVRALLDRSKNAQVVGDPSKPHVTRMTAVSVPKKDGTNETYLQCQYCPFRVCKCDY